MSIIIGLICGEITFKIFYMVALDSFVTFSPNLSKFSGRGGGGPLDDCVIF